MIRPLIAVALCAFAAACASPRQEAEDKIVNPLERYPLTVHPEADETLLAVHPTGLSTNQTAALAAAGERWRDAGSPVIAVRVPEGAPQQDDARIMAEQVRGVLAQQGVTPEAVRLEGYDAKGDPAAPIVASFESVKADIPKCGQDWDNLTGTQSNNNYGNFGCAISANMAAQIADPRELVQSKATTPADAGRRALVMDNYRKGTPTGATVDPNGSGTVSQAVK